MLKIFLNAVRGQLRVVADGDGKFDAVGLAELVQPVQELFGLDIAVAGDDLGQAVDEDVGDV